MRAIGGAIKPVVWAARIPSGVEAFVGPALLSSREPLAAVDGALNGIRLNGKYVSDLFFSGPSAGPKVTAATLLDDAVEEVASVRHDFSRASGSTDGAVSAPLTSWFVRVTFPGVVPADRGVQTLVSASGLDIEQVVEQSNGPSRWLTTGSHSREEVTDARARLRARHRIESYAIRRLP